LQLFPFDINFFFTHTSWVLTDFLVQKRLRAALLLRTTFRKHNHYRALCVVSRGCTFHGVRVTAPCKHYFGSKSTVRSAVGRVFTGEYYT
jgi:hypothetical protein